MDDVKFSATEMEILRWVQEGKSNAEIAIIIGKSKWAVKYHLSNIMKKLDVSSRTQAVSQAIGQGILNPLNGESGSKRKKAVQVGIVGCGKGGAAIMEILKENPSLNIACVVEKDPKASGLSVANELNVPVVNDFHKLFKQKLDVIINLTGSKKVRAEIEKLKDDDTEVMGGISAMLMWQLADERRKRTEDKKKVLREHEALYHLGLIIENIDSMKDAGYAVVDYATKLLNMPAGSLVIYDEKNEEMRLVASKGLSKALTQNDRWSLRKGGLTSKVFNSSGPLFIPDLKEADYVSTRLLKEGVCSLLATPLVAEGKIVGILYVNDFKKRLVRAEDISIFSIISVYAAMTIERVKSIEDMRMLSIIDGLTNLYNHRHVMEQLQKEHNRAERHKSKFSVIMLDIDKFKPYNDKFGHMEGNKVLKGVAGIFKDVSRVTDIVGRFGGEEFCIIAPELDRNAATEFANRIVREVEKHKFPNRKITISGGVATYPDDGITPTALMEKADDYLYVAKRTGRNRVCSALSASDELCAKKK